MCVCVCVVVGVGVGVGGWGDTCATGNLSLSKECDSDPGIKVSVLVCASVYRSRCSVSVHNNDRQ